MVSDPALILADEPTGNLDEQSSAEILALFQRLHREGRTVVMITHDRAVAEHARRILLLKDGSIAADETVDLPRHAEAAKAER